MALYWIYRLIGSILNSKLANRIPWFWVRITKVTGSLLLLSQKYKVNRILTEILEFLVSFLCFVEFEAKRYLIWYKIENTEYSGIFHFLTYIHEFLWFPTFFQSYQSFKQSYCLSFGILRVVLGSFSCPVRPLWISKGNRTSVKSY